MIRIIKFIIFSFILIVFTNVVSGKESFFEEALKMYEQKNMMMQNFYLKEILCLIQKTLIHTYI